MHVYSACVCVHGFSEYESVPFTIRSHSIDHLCHYDDLAQIPESELVPSLLAYCSTPVARYHNFRLDACSTSWWFYPVIWRGMGNT